MTIYSTNEWEGFGNNNYYWFEYRVEEGKVLKYKCHRQKGFDGEESVWKNDENVVAEWEMDDPGLPDWLHQYL